MTPPMNGPTTPIVAPSPPADSASEVASKLTEAQRHFVLMSSPTALHPCDIDSSGVTAKAMVVRGLAYRTICRLLGQWKGDSFNGYGLTPLGLAVRAHLLASQVPGPISNERGDE